ncbi:MAG: LysR family transcriptional regulator [Parvularculaceae bacterium]
MFDPRRVTFKQLRALAAVANRGSVSQAAEDLNVTPPAVSLQLRELERNAGAPLFERRPEGMKPTQAARELLVVHRRTEAALSAAGEALSALSGVEIGKVSVGVISTAKYFAPRALAAFIKLHPKVEVRLNVANRADTIAALDDFSLDFALMGRPPDGDHFEYVTIGDHPHIMIAPPDHPLAARKRIKLADLADETFLLREEGSGTRSMLEELFAENRIIHRAGMEIGSNETIKQAVMAGIGVALISAHTVSAEIADGRLARLCVSGTPVMRKWLVVKRTERRLSPAGHALWDFLAREGARYLPTPENEKTSVHGKER